MAPGCHQDCPRARFASHMRMPCPAEAEGKLLPIHGFFSPASGQIRLCRVANARPITSSRAALRRLPRPNKKRPRVQLFLPIADIPVNVFLILAMGAAVGFVS